MAADARERAMCEIRFEGHLDSLRREWFDGLALEHRLDRTTVLSGAVADQASLYGLLERARDLGLRLLPVHVN
jgi:hypothetical protein